ncbi:MAG: PAC2 family protein, partial [Dehalococcoidia bacterium]|nr:PAC2 family protein [Dehalococcoidia bacterium]
VIYSAHPGLRKPRMVLALDGWVDGGEAATGSVRFLRRKLRPRKLAEIPAGHFHIYQVPGQLSLRPYSRVEDGLVKEYRPPRNVFYYWENHGGDADLILFEGAEPNLNWDDYTQAILQVAREFDVPRIYMLGGVLDKTPHTREPAVSCVCSSAELRDELRMYGVEPTEYEGPGGIRTALVAMCQKLPIEMAVLHARVTYYPEFNMVIAHNPKSIRALIKRLNRLLALGLDLAELDRETRDFEARMGYFALQNREFRSYIEALEKEYPPSVDEDVSDLSADAAIRAAEEFLRQRTDEDR